MKLVAVEGLDKSGKRTAVATLQDVFESRGLTVKVVSFPQYETPLGERIRAWLKGEWDVDARTFELVQAADKQSIQSQLSVWEKEDVDVVLFDRYLHSQWAYGLYDNPTDWVLSLSKHARRPDVVIYMDVAVDVSMSRQGEHGKNDKYEENRDRLVKAKDAYTKLLTVERQARGLNVYTVDANRSEAFVKQTVIAVANKLNIVKGRG